jgi:hypothetical protein
MEFSVPLPPGTNITGLLAASALLLVSGKITAEKPPPS